MRLEFNELPNKLDTKDDITPAFTSSDSPSDYLNARDSYAPSIYTTPIGTTPGLTPHRETPIADLFKKSPSKSMISLHAEEEETAPPMNRARSESAASQISVTPSLQLELGSEPTDDWAQSVQSELLAAQVESDKLVDDIS